MTFLIGLALLGLLGLIVLQGFLLANAYDLREETFRRNVWSALTTASIRLETGLALRLAYGAGSSPVGAPVRIEGDSLRFRVGTPQRIQIQISDGYGRDSILVDTMKAAGVHTLQLQEKGERFFRFTSDSAAFVVATAVDSPSGASEPGTWTFDRKVVVSRVLGNLTTRGLAEPMSARLSPATLDSVLQRSMREAGIPLEYSYGILARGTRGEDTLVMASAGAAGADLAQSEFRVPIDPLGPFGSHHRLAVEFPDRRGYLLRLLWPLFAGSFIFIAAITAAFVISLRTISRQRRLASQMTEFINTMTHEFKTPISTVALASEAIGRPDVVGRKSRVLRFNRMIADETARMKGRVDRILEYARLEGGDVELENTPLDAHQLIRTAAEAFDLQVKARDGVLTLSLDSPRTGIRGDAVHLTSVIQSLLDNANKYSPALPELSVRTETRDDELLIRVADRGCGIPVEYHRRVFEKYVRVPTGELHDVKGFGLGLSYVKLIVEAHGGTTTLKSTPGKGTEVTVTLPLAE